MKKYKTHLIRVYGVVQGVGFRPFVRNLAARLELCGSVCNRGSFVEIIIQGGEQKLAAFLHLLKENAPTSAVINNIEIAEILDVKLTNFTIINSVHQVGEVFISPDIAICEQCKKELFDVTDRRYLHPFINCTNCGPRATIISEMPYDRHNTSMNEFEMCVDCASEYSSPQNRRFHAQPVCCNKCGPKLYTIPKTEGDPITNIRRIIMAGGIVAIKGIGGFHLCCDAKNSNSIKKLRIRKNRLFKPFAIMLRDIATIRTKCEITAFEEELLQNCEKPIVLLKRLPNSEFCKGIAPENPNVGVMLPYAPIQMLLFNYSDGINFTDSLIMTSGNQSGAPICIDDEQAKTQLSSMCDLIISNNRQIKLRADDSVTSTFNDKIYMLRLSRGYSPLPFQIDGVASQKHILAVGGELKNSFCLAKGRLLYLSPFVGDLTDLRCVNALDESRLHLQNLLQITPQLVVCDMHPNYNSVSYAKQLNLPVLQVQHHFAHIASCLAENNINDEVIGVAFDGIGYGTDGTLWGGEFIKASFKGFERLGKLEEFTLAGGDLASSEGYRPAVSLLLQNYKDNALEKSISFKLCSEKQFTAIKLMINNNINCVQTTSAGRLYDAVSALLGIKLLSSFEGEAAMALEFAAQNGSLGNFGLEPEIKEGLPFSLKTDRIIRYIVEQRLNGISINILAMQFHEALSQMILAGCLKCRELTSIEKVALSGGVFQNLLLLRLCDQKLTKNGFEVILHSKVPPNDGGIALGQAAIGLNVEFRI
jgi:hydrogenase maturation protein HypF